MACCLFSAKPLSEPMLTYWQLKPQEHISMEFYLKFKHFNSMKWFHVVICGMIFMCLGIKHMPASLVINSLWPADAIWLYLSGSTLAQIIACCLMTPSHYLNNCWLWISRVVWHSPESNFTVSAHVTIMYNEFENHIFKLMPHIPLIPGAIVFKPVTIAKVPSELT